MAEYEFLTYREAAERLGITLASARRLATRNKGWPRQTGNDGLTRIGIPAERLKAARHDDGTPGAGNDGAADDGKGETLSAMREHIATLRDALTRAEARADKAQEEATRAQIEAAELRGRMARPWWRRW